MANPFRQPADYLDALTAPTNPKVVSSYLLFELFDLLDLMDAEVMPPCPSFEDTIDLPLEATV